MWKPFSKALIVADRFDGIRLVNQQFLAVWSPLDPSVRKNRGLLSLVRDPQNLSPEQSLRLQAYLETQPAFQAVYGFWQKLCRPLRLKTFSHRKARRLARCLLWVIDQLKLSRFPALGSLGRTIDSWKNEIARMWRFRCIAVEYGALPPLRVKSRAGDGGP